MDAHLYRQTHRKKDQLTHPTWYPQNHLRHELKASTNIHGQTFRVSAIRLQVTNYDAIML